MDARVEPAHDKIRYWRTPMTSFRCNDGERTDVRAADRDACTCCNRRAFLRGTAAAEIGALAPHGQARAQAMGPAPEKPFRIDVHHHLSSPGFIAVIKSRKTGQIPL